MVCEKDIFDYLAALLTPTIAFIGIILAVLNYRLNLRRRKDELFDRRFDFFKKVEGIWLSTGNAVHYGKAPHFDWDDIEPFALEAEFLFNKKIADYLRSLADKVFRGNSNAGDPEFNKKFSKYLAL